MILAPQPIATEIDDYLLTLALNEDLGKPWRDVTTELLFPESHGHLGKARIISKHLEPIVICGLAWVMALFHKLSPACSIYSDYHDGDLLSPGQTLLRLEGPAPALLKGERTALNLLRHACAIATLTAQYVKRVSHTRLKILDTRKTTPGLRYLEKYAVHCGGGVNHRMGLYDAIMVKDTHIDLLGGMQNTLTYLPELNALPPASLLPVIVEVRSLAELHWVIELGQKKINRVLLDNMPPELIRQCVYACRGIFATEASGNIRLNTVTTIAETGVDYASVGELTYGAGHVDLSMQSLTETMT